MDNREPNDLDMEEVRKAKEIIEDTQDFINNYISKKHPHLNTLTLIDCLNTLILSIIIAFKKVNLTAYEHLRLYYKIVTQHSCEDLDKDDLDDLIEPEIIANKNSFYTRDLSGEKN